MSREVVLSTIALADKYNKPVALIASRRQIDSEEFNGGYVENWTTSDFVRFVRERDKKGNVIIARDHGGPWQNPLELSNSLGLVDALDSAKRSFYEDIKSGFDMIHIDTSIDLHSGHISPEETVDRLLDLYTFCDRTTKDFGREVIYEVGTEEQSSDTNSLEINSEILSRTQEELTRKNIQLPHFIVLQTGTRVYSDRNIGVLNSFQRVPDILPPEILLPQIMRFCDKYNIWLKEHNLDYSSTDLLAWHPRLGIHSANVAPEFGVVQSTAIFQLLKSYNLESHLDSLVTICVDSQYWKKWTSDDDTPYHKAILCAHYNFSNSTFKDVLSDAFASIESRGANPSTMILSTVTSAIERYLVPFGY